jgi:hypothetical protein
MVHYDVTWSSYSTVPGSKNGLEAVFPYRGILLCSVFSFFHGVSSSKTKLQPTVCARYGVLVPADVNITLKSDATVFTLLCRWISHIPPNMISTKIDGTTTRKSLIFINRAVGSELLSETEVLLKPTLEAYSWSLLWRLHNCVGWHIGNKVSLDTAGSFLLERASPIHWYQFKKYMASYPKRLESSLPSQWEFRTSNFLSREATIFYAACWTRS